MEPGRSFRRRRSLEGSSGGDGTAQSSPILSSLIEIPTQSSLIPWQRTRRAASIHTLTYTYTLIPFVLQYAASIHTLVHACRRTASALRVLDPSGVDAYWWWACSDASLPPAPGAEHTPRILLRYSHAAGTRRAEHLPPPVPGGEYTQHTAGTLSAADSTSLRLPPPVPGGADGAHAAVLACAGGCTPRCTPSSRHRTCHRRYRKARPASGTGVPPSRMRCGRQTKGGEVSMLDRHAKEREGGNAGGGVKSGLNPLQIASPSRCAAGMPRAIADPATRSIPAHASQIEPRSHRSSPTRHEHHGQADPARIRFFSSVNPVQIKFDSGVNRLPDSTPP